MSDDLMIKVANAVIAMAQRECQATHCGCECRWGSQFRHLRCGDCPMDNVDPVIEALLEPVET